MIRALIASSDPNADWGVLLRPLRPSLASDPCLRPRTKRMRREHYARAAARKTDGAFGLPRHTRVVLQLVDHRVQALLGFVDLGGGFVHVQQTGAHRRCDAIQMTNVFEHV